jgi:hypothetical protein
LKFTTKIAIQEQFFKSRRYHIQVKGGLRGGTFGSFGVARSGMWVGQRTIGFAWELTALWGAGCRVVSVAGPTKQE